jgi:predicted phage-related endonuclease
MGAATIDLEERKTYLGASEAAAALGMSPWNDPIGLALDKWGEREPKEASFRMRLGLLVEPVIGELYRQETGATLKAGGSRTRRMVDHPWIGAHPDFYVLPWERGGTRTGLVQAKLSDEFDGEVPLHYRLQGIAEIAVTGAPWIDFAVLEARDFKVYRVTPEPGEVEDLVADLDDYWNGYIVPKILPPPSAESGAALRSRYAKPEKVGKIGSAAQGQKLAKIADLKAEQKRLHEEEKRLANEIKAAIGSAHYLEADGYRATWSRWESEKTDWKLVAETQRKIVERLSDNDPVVRADLDTLVGLYTTTEPGDRLNLTTPKERT